MGLLNRLRNIGGIFNYGSRIPSMDSVARKIDFFELRGFDGLPDVVIDFDSLVGLDDSYARCPTLSTIINRNALALTNGKWWITDKKDNDVSSKFKGIANLLKRPNPLQSWTAFMVQLDVYRQLYGEVFVAAVVPVGFTIQEASALWVVNPKYVDIKISGKMYQQTRLEDIVLNYSICIDGKNTEVDPGHILHIKDSFQNISMSPSDIRGTSRLCGLEHAVRNVIQAEEAVYALNKDRGAMGILSNKSRDAAGYVPLSDTEKGNLESKFDGYGIKVGQKKVIITDADLQWQQMSFNVRDLMLFEGVESNVRRISEALGYPSELLNNTQGTTFNNKREAKSLYYQDSIIPIAQMYAEEFTRFFGLERACFVVDYGNVEALRRSESEKAETTHKMNQAMKVAYESGVISTAEWRLALGLDEEIYKPDKTENNGNQGNENTGEEAEE